MSDSINIGGVWCIVSDCITWGQSLADEKEGVMTCRIQSKPIMGSRELGRRVIRNNIRMATIFPQRRTHPKRRHLRSGSAVFFLLALGVFLAVVMGGVKMSEERYTVEKITERMGRKMAVPDYEVRDTVMASVFRCSNIIDAVWLAKVLNEHEARTE